MARKSAGILMYRIRNQTLEVLLVHPGGPFWARKDLGAWSIAKGEYDLGEDPLEAAKREFQEETGHPANGRFLALGQIKQPGGKVVTAWALEGDLDAQSIRSNTFTMEWPPKSGKMSVFPEVDRAGWFAMDLAKDKILKGQVGFLEELEKMLRPRNRDLQNNA
jgi:predicted NUDIX family NTP pyrophosphohydrolase